MSQNDEPKSKKSSVEQKGMIVGIIIGIVGFQILGPEKTEPGFSFTHVLYAAIVAGICAPLGALIGKAIAGGKN